MSKPDVGAAVVVSQDIVDFQRRILARKGEEAVVIRAGTEESVLKFANNWTCGVSNNDFVVRRGPRVVEVQVKRK